MWRKILLIGLVVISLGFIRDSIFKTINALLRSWDLEEDYFLPSFLKFLEHFEYDTLVNFKWVLTIIFSILYLCLSLITIYIVFNNRTYLKITVFSYITLLLFAGAFMSVGFVFHGTAEKMNTFARFLMGLAQSPLILMILIPAFKLSEKENDKTSEL